MGKDRVLGSSATIALYGPNGPVSIAECDSFKATRKSSQKQFQPLGQVGERTQDVYGGYDLDIGGAVVDPSYDYILDEIDSAALAGQANIRFRVTETVQYYDGSTKTYVYPDTVLYSPDKDIASAKDEIKWTFKGSAQTRVAG